MADHLENYEQTPETLTADAGYGSEENYTDLEAKNITAFVKYNYFHKEQQDQKKARLILSMLISYITIKRQTPITVLWDKQ